MFVSLYRVNDSVADESTKNYPLLASGRSLLWPCLSNPYLKLCERGHRKVSVAQW